MKRKIYYLIPSLILLFYIMFYAYAQFATTNYNRTGLKKVAYTYCYKNISEDTLKSTALVSLSLQRIDPSTSMLEGTSVPVVVLNNKNAKQFKINAVSRFINDINYKLLFLNGCRAVRAEVTRVNTDSPDHDRMIIYINPFTGRVFGFNYTQ